MKSSLNRRSYLKSFAFTLLAALAFVFSPNQLEAKPKVKPTSLNVIPQVTSLQLVNGQLVASGTVTAQVKGVTHTAPFSNVPVNLGLAADQTGAGACPILDLELGPINLDLLGLVVQTSPICLKITAYEGGGLLGDLLCSVAGLLDGGLNLNQILSGAGVVDPVTNAVILPGLTPDDINALLSGLTNLLNTALNQLLQGVLTGILDGAAQQTCAILHLELGPVNLTLLGLEVILDDCEGGPVVMDITGQTGQGKLLGNLLCELLGGGLIDLGTTLQNLLNQLAGLLNQ